MKTSFYILLIFSFTFIYSQNIIWQKRLDLSQYEYGYCVTKDSLDNIIIAGVYQDTTTWNWDILILKYNSNGDTIWHRQYDRYPIDFAVDLATEPNGNIIIASRHNEYSNEIPGLAKFLPDGETLWTRTYPKLDGCMISGIALDPFNNILVCGASLDSPYTFISKFDTSGNLVWLRLYDWGRNGWQDFSDIVLDTTGNIIITGLLGETMEHGDLLIAKFNGNGDSMWTRRFSTGRWITRGINLVLDSGGNIIVSGIDTDGTMSYDCVTVKYSNTGNLLWNRILNFEELDYNSGITIDNNDNIFVSGDCGLPDQYDYFLVKYSPSGDTLWTSFYNGGYDDNSGGLTIDRQGNPIISGSSSNGANYDVLTIKYQGSSGIEEHNPFEAKSIMSGLEIYPNPAKSYLVVRLPLSAEGRVLKIFDVSGKMIKSVSKVTKQELRVSLKGMNPGIYFLKLGKETKKFLIVK